ncbi:MAG TPA: hypothetical protein VGQ26_24045 [Streptosporangiaceae bacterium]|jgi:hypothetical protein|nr:hypothetical protein [Streptosporangiaceae bacterium]
MTERDVVTVRGLRKTYGAWENSSYGAALVGPSLVVRVERRLAPARHWLRGLCEPDLLEATDF